MGSVPPSHSRHHAATSAGAGGSRSFTDVMSESRADAVGHDKADPSAATSSDLGRAASCLAPHASRVAPEQGSFGQCVPCCAPLTMRYVAAGDKRRKARSASSLSRAIRRVRSPGYLDSGSSRIDLSNCRSRLVDFRICAAMIGAARPANPDASPRLRRVMCVPPVGVSFQV